MDYESFVRAVADRIGGGDVAAGKRAAEVVLEALGECMLGSDARRVAALLPDPLPGLLLEGEYGGELNPQDVFDRAARRLELEVGFAREHVQIVCEQLVESLEPDAVTAFHTHLPASVAALLAKQPHPPSADPHHRRHRKGSPLSEGKPGSARPLSEASAAVVHSGSIVSTDNPHADTKLSSSAGMTQEREHESLADGTGRSDLPLSEGED